MSEELPTKPAASLRELLKDVAGRLAAVSESPRLDAELLLARAIDMPRSYFFAHPEDAPDAKAIARLEKNVARRLAGEPMAYIDGSKEFWSLDLMVTPATLVPRPETEVLVGLALREIPQDSAWQVLDLGTGSGAIAVALGRERPIAQITAVEQSTAALQIAAQNVRHLNLGNVACVQGNWTEPVKNRVFDLIVSNPPYVESGHDDLHKLSAEPQQALVAGEDGLDAIRILARDCGAILKPGGALMLEHGSEQQASVAAILSEHGWEDIQCHRDLAGLPRISTARKIAPPTSN